MQPSPDQAEGPRQMLSLKSKMNPLATNVQLTLIPIITRENRRRRRMLTRMGSAEKNHRMPMRMVALPFPKLKLMTKRLMTIIQRNRQMKTQSRTIIGYTCFSLRLVNNLFAQRFHRPF